MSSWSWSPRSVSWHQQLAFSLGFVAWVEGPFFYSDFVRGLTVGLSTGALLVMLAGRRAMHALLCAFLVGFSFTMTPRPTEHLPGLIAAHTLAAFMLVAPLLAALNQRRLARG